MKLFKRKLFDRSFKHLHESMANSNISFIKLEEGESSHSVLYRPKLMAVGFSLQAYVRLEKIKRDNEFGLKEYPELRARVWKQSLCYTVYNADTGENDTVFVDEGNMKLFYILYNNEQFKADEITEPNPLEWDIQLKLKKLPDKRIVSNLDEE